MTLVLGAGTGNDVAVALSEGAEHVDAVEIDPVILELGSRLHPDHPYVSPRQFRPIAHLPRISAASADREIGLQFLKICLLAQRLCRRRSLGKIVLLTELGLYCRARPNRQMLAGLLGVVDTHGKAVGSGLL